MPTAQPDAAVADALAAAGLSLAKGVNLFRGPVRPDLLGVANKAVFCLATGGPRNERFLGTASDYRVSTVQIRVRTGPGEFDAGQTLARAIRDALHATQPEGYVSMQVREGEPNFLGQFADDDTYQWSLNVELERVT